MQVLEHLTEEIIERYRARTVAATELLRVQTHVKDCADCRAKMERAVNADEAVRALRAQFAVDDFADEPTHLPYEQLAFYVDGKLDEVEQEIADSHLSFCESCATDLADLRRYQTIAATESSLSSVGTQANVASANADNSIEASQPFDERPRAIVENKPAWWQRLFAFDLLSMNGAFAGAAAVVVIAVLALGIWFAARNETFTGNEVANVKPSASNTIAPTPVPTATPQSQSDAQNNSVEPSSNQNSSNPQNSQGVQNSTGGESAPTSAPPAPRRTPQTQTNDATPSAPEIAFNDGGAQVTLGSDGNINGLEAQPTSVREAVRRAVRSQRAQPPGDLNSIANGQTGVLMSGTVEANAGVPFALVSPIGKAVREATPTLRWRPLAGAKNYSVTVVDQSFHVVAQSPVLTQTEWTPTQPLARGANYSWQVTAVQADGTETVSPVAPAPQAKFRVIDQRSFDEVKRAEATKSHLARGVIYAEAGLIDEARAEFQALVRDNPRSALARKLLDSLDK